MKNNPNISFPSRHFTVQSLAAHWEVSPSHIYNLIHSNTLRHMRIGKAIRIPIHFVKEYEENACQEAMKNIMATLKWIYLCYLDRIHKK